jgi:hypothetical protein
VKTTKDGYFGSRYEMHQFAVHVVDQLMKSERKERFEQADQNVPVAKDVSSSAEGATDEELVLVAASKMRLPKEPAVLDKLLKLRPRHSKNRDVTRALLDERKHSR